MSLWLTNCKPFRSYLCCHAGQLVREVEVISMPGSAIAAVQQCCVQHNRYQLCVSSQEQATLSCMQVDDAVASQTVLADTLASMEVQKPGRTLRILHALHVSSQCKTVKKAYACGDSHVTKDSYQGKVINGSFNGCTPRA